MKALCPCCCNDPPRRLTCPVCGQLGWVEGGEVTTGAGMDREVLRQQLIDDFQRLAGLRPLFISAEERGRARACVAFWRTAGEAELDRFQGYLNLVREEIMAKQKMSAAETKALATALGIDMTAPNWLAILGAAMKALQWIMDLLGKQPMMATAQSAGAKAGHEDTCCACLEAADLALQSAKRSLECACDCCDTP